MIVTFSTSSSGWSPLRLQEKMPEKTHSSTVVVSRWYEKSWLVYECLTVIQRCLYECLTVIQRCLYEWLTVIQRCLYLLYGRLGCPCPEMKKDWNVDGVPWGRMLLFLFSCLPSKLREYFCQELEHIADWINLSFSASLFLLANFSKKRKFYFKILILEVFNPQKWGKKKVKMARFLYLVFSVWLKT
jgi:CDP-diglyceride synthetase